MRPYKMFGNLIYFLNHKGMHKIEDGKATLISKPKQKKGARMPAKKKKVVKKTKRKKK